MAVNSVGGIAQVFTAADQNGSGGLGFAEYSALRAKLTTSAGVAPSVSKTGSSAGFADFDADQNGEVDRAEFTRTVANLSTDIATVLLAVQEQRSTVASVLAKVEGDAYRDLSAASADVVVADTSGAADSQPTATDTTTNDTATSVGTALTAATTSPSQNLDPLATSSHEPVDVSV